MNFGFSFLLTLVCCWLAVVARPSIALSAVAFASLLGTYVINESWGRQLLPGPLVAMAFVARGSFWLVAVRGPVFARFTGRKWFLFIFFYAVCVTAIAPRIFGGRIEVIRPGMVAGDFRFAVPLEFSISNIAQVIYLAISVLLIFISAKMSRNDETLLAKLTGLLVSFSFVMGMILILDFLLNIATGSVNLYGFVMGENFGDIRPDRYDLSGIFGLPLRRAQAVFGEPSYFSAFTLGTLAASFVSLRNSGRFGDKIRFSVILTSLLLSFSTTAYIGTAIVLLILSLTPVQRKDVRRAVPLATLVFIVLLIAAAALWILSSQDLSAYIFEKLSDNEGFEEGNFSSGAERLYWDLTALGAFTGSSGLGVGVGSTRASSAFINVAASLGVFGAILFATLIWFCLKRMFSRIESGNSAEIQAGAALVFGWLFVFSISVPDLTSFFYFPVALGVLLEKWSSQKYRNVTPALESYTAREL